MAKWNEKLKQLREKEKWSQYEAAEKCGTTQKTYWMWETGQSYPQKNNRRYIAKAFRVTEKYLFSEE
jgi:transcriptional regulator with XRE-family HTH domain